MGTGASSHAGRWLCNTSPTELSQVVQGLDKEERDKLHAAVQLLDQQALPDPDPDRLGDAFVEGEEVLFLWVEPEGGVPDCILPSLQNVLITIDGVQWEKTTFQSEKDDGTLVLRARCYGSRNLSSVARHLVRRYPYGMRPPQLSGITLGQLKNLHMAHKDWLEEPKWNAFARQMLLPTMYDIVPAIIKPATEHTRGSYVELFTQKAVDVFVSHWWGGEFVEFVAALDHAAAQLLHDDALGLFDKQRSYLRPKLQGRAPDSIVFWICSFANAQWTVNLGNTLQESPFEIALSSETCSAVVMVMDENAMPLTRIWCIYEVLRTGVLRHPFYVATGHGILVGERVRESPQLAKSLLVLAEKLSELRPQHADASNAEDRAAILNEVSSAVGVEQFALAVQASLFEVLRKAGYALYSRNWRLNFKLLQVHREAVREVYWLQPGTNRNRAAYRPPTEAPPQRTLLHRAAQEGDVETLQQEIDLDKVRLEKARVAFEELKVLRKSYERYRERTEKEAELRGINEEVSDRVDELGQKALHLAARYCHDTEALQWAAQQFPDHVQHRDKFGRLPLHRAAESGSAKSLDVLLPLYADRRLEQELDKKQHSCLDLAVLSGKVEAVDLLLQKRAVAAHSNKRTPLHLAAQWNHTDILKHLLGLGFPDTADCDGTRPLHLAARFGHEEAVAALVGLRADVSAKTAFGRTALHWAALNGHVKVAQLLLESGSPPNERDGAGWTALHWALRRGHSDCARQLQLGGVDIHCKDLRSSRNALHIAASSELDAEILEDLTCWGLKLLETDVAQKTPLHLAAQWGKIQHVAKLLQMNSDAEARCSHERTALHLAARWGHASICRALVEAGADVHVKDANGATPFAVACRFGRFDAVLALAECQVDVTCKEQDGMTCLHWAGHFGNAAAIQNLAEKRASVTAVTRYGRSPLHCAAIAGHEAAAVALIKLRSDVHQAQKDGWQPIHLASRFQHFQVIKSLIEYRADPNARGVNGKTPAHCVAQRDEGYHSNVGFDHLQQDDSGRNSLHISAIHGHDSFFAQYRVEQRNPAGEQLVMGLAVPDAQGRTPLHLAAAHGQHRVVKAILQCFVDDEGNFNKRWHRPKHRHRGFYAHVEAQEDEENNDVGEPPPLPVLAPDRRGRLPLHAAALGGFPMVIGHLVSFMKEHLYCSVDDILRLDNEGASALDLACRRRDDAAARRLCEKLGLEPRASRWRGDPVAAGQEVCLKWDLSLGEHRPLLPKGTVGRVQMASDSTVELQFGASSGVHQLTMNTFLYHCAGKRKYVVNASSYRKRVKGLQALSLTKQTQMPASLQKLSSRAPEDDDDDESSKGTGINLKEGSVVEGFDLDDGWLQLKGGGWLPSQIQVSDKSSRSIHVLSAWCGPPVKVGEVIRIVKELTVAGGRVVKEDSVGIIHRLNPNAAMVKFGAAKGGSMASIPDSAFADHVEMTGYACIMEEPGQFGPPKGVLVTHREHGCGMVQPMESASAQSNRKWSDGFSVVFGNGTRSQLPADRRGIRLISRPPRPEEVATYLRLKATTLARKHTES